MYNSKNIFLIPGNRFYIGEIGAYYFQIKLDRRRLKYTLIEKCYDEANLAYFWWICFET